ncbi:hypothetical protein PG991_000488 [Apiospora marii]|uniref:Uncharacterized protein n=1 Tax=Apiospora marii TaxID=335849 RepID=A0ABR1T414_9PEZI
MPKLRYIPYKEAEVSLKTTYYSPLPDRQAPSGIGTRKLLEVPYAPWKADKKSREPIYPSTPFGKPSLLKAWAPWGFAVYRTDYSDDAAWRRMQRELEKHAIRRGLGRRGGDRLSLILRHRMVFFDEDRATLDGARRKDVRVMFAHWAAEELRRNWNITKDRPLPDLDSARGTDAQSPGYRAGARYNFCLMVDADALRSLDSKTPSVTILRKDISKIRESSSQTAAEVDKVHDAYLLPLHKYVGACRLLLSPENWYLKDE